MASNDVGQPKLRSPEEREERWRLRDEARERHEAQMARQHAEERTRLCAAVTKAIRVKVPALAPDAFLMAAIAIDALYDDGVVFARMGSPDAFR